MEQFISLILKASDYCDECPKIFYQLCRDNLPSGIMTTVQIGEKQASLRKTTNEGKTTLTVPLTRHLTGKETTSFVETFDGLVERDYQIVTSKIDTMVEKEIEVVVDSEPLLSLATAWARTQHDEWVRDKTDAGWRYGTDVSVKNKTHPLIRTWNDLPDEYRKIDTSKPEELLKLFNDQGYILVAKTEMDQLLK